MKLPIYLDFNATTPVDELVVERMLPFFTSHFGNPSSKGHAFGWAASEGVDQAREQVAAMIGAAAREITFTSGSTEALNLAIRGVAAAYRRKGNHLVTLETEHKAVLDTCKALERDGSALTILPVQSSGLVDLHALEAALTEETILVAIMWANNETGVLQPMEEIAEIVRGRGVLLLSDTTQAIGKVPVSAAQVDLMVGSAHKVYGPKGVGFLYASKRQPRVRLVPLNTGGGQEDGIRGGTLNTPGIVGLGAALEEAQTAQPDEAARLEALRNRFEADLKEALGDIIINGAAAPRLPQTSNITFPGVPADKLMLALRDLAVSTGSACSSGSSKPSHVLTAMGVSLDDARSTIRFSLGRFTTAEEMAYATEQVIASVGNLRESEVV